MAARKVYVHLKQAGEAGTNKLEISVHPWTVHVWPDDTVTFVKMNAQIVDIVIAKSRKNIKWPLEPRRLVAGIRNAVLSLKPRPVKRSKTVRYKIVITFNDDAGHTRTASIDPDMVIEV